MKIFDMHIHARNTKPTTKLLLENMEKTGIYGGCIFSNRPARLDSDRGTSFDERLDEVLGWTRGYEDRLFPIMWIHPYEENMIENVRKAIQCGIYGFKIICDDFYVYEEKCMEVLREIAKLDKPVFFIPEYSGTERSLLSITVLFTGKRLSILKGCAFRWGIAPGRGLMNVLQCMVNF